MMKTQLPEAFLTRMEQYLGPDFGPFLASYSEKPVRGIRLNPLKAEPEIVARVFGAFTPTPFSPLTFTVNTEKVGDMPLHSAGAFYAQEPSAASAVTVLDPQPGERVLDLCAAPGGKSTQIAALLNGRGLLWSNEVVKSRANILLSNVERMGVKNAVLSSCHPEQLCTGLRGFFHKILVDAPCSGEGMFRKNPQAAQEWSLEHVEACAQRQLSILNSAAMALTEGGILVYSTCTFSKEENEGVCEAFLLAHPEFSLVSPGVSFGRKAYGIDALRILPMDGGEGHFVAKFLKNSREQPGYGLFQYPAVCDKAGAALYESLFFDTVFGPIYQVKDKLLLLPADLPDIRGLGVIRAGVELGEVKGSRIEPSHALFACQRAENCRSCMDLSSSDAALHRYLRGEEIESQSKGFTAVAADGVVLGFGKASGGVLKNRYPKGLRFR